MDVAEPDAKLTLSRVVARNTVVQLVGRGLTMAVALATVMVLTRYLGVEGVGQYLLVSSLITLLNFSDMGLFLITVRELSAEKEKPDVLLGNVLVLRVVTAGASMLLAVIVALTLNYSPEVTAAIIVGSFSYFLIAIGSGSLGAIFVAKLRMEFQVLGNVVQAVVFIVLVALVTIFELGIVAIFLAYNASVLANTLVVIAISRRFVIPRLRLDGALCRRILMASIPAGVSTIAWILYSRIDMVLLSQMKDAEAVGLYGLAYRFVDLAFPIGFFFVGSVYPILSRHYKAEESTDFRWLLQRSTDVLTLLALGPITILFVFAEPILRIVASDDFTPATTTLRILAVAIFPLWLGMLSAYTLIATEKQVALLWIGLTALAVNIITNLILIPGMSYEGAAVATLITEGTALFLSLAVIYRHVGYIPSFGTAARMAPPLVAASAAAVLLTPNSIPAQIAFVVPGLAAAYFFSRAISISDIRALVGGRPAPEAGAYASAGELG